jgi:hypothetical protein
MTFPELKLSIDLFTIEAYKERDTSVSSIITMPMQKKSSLQFSKQFLLLVAVGQ